MLLSVVLNLSIAFLTPKKATHIGGLPPVQRSPSTERAQRTGLCPTSSFEMSLAGIKRLVAEHLRQTQHACPLKRQAACGSSSKGHHRFWMPFHWETNPCRRCVRRMCIHAKHQVEWAKPAEAGVRVFEEAKQSANLETKATFWRKRCRMFQESQTRFPRGGHLRGRYKSTILPSSFCMVCGISRGRNTARTNATLNQGHSMRLLIL